MFQIGQLLSPQWTLAVGRAFYVMKIPLLACAYHLVLRTRLSAAVPPRFRERDHSCEYSLSLCSDLSNCGLSGSLPTLNPLKNLTTLYVFIVPSFFSLRAYASLLCASQEVEQQQFFWYCALVWPPSPFHRVRRARPALLLLLLTVPFRDFSNNNLSGSIMNVLTLPGISNPYVNFVYAIASSCIGFSIHF